MREILLQVLVLGICCVGLVRPRIGLYGYLWFSLMRPDVLAFANPSFGYSRYLAYATLAGSLRYIPDALVVFTNPICRWLLALQIPIGLSVWLALNPSLALEPYSLYVRTILMVLLIPILVRTERELFRLLLVVTWSVGFLGLKYGMYGLLHGGVQYSAGYGNSTMSGNNEMGMAFAMVVPLCWYSARLVVSRLARYALFTAAFASATATIMTYSRGAALALAGVLLIIVFQSRRKAAVLVLVGLMLAPTLYLVRNSYVERLATLKSPTEEASAKDRLVLAGAAIHMWRDHPIFGVGFGRLNFMEQSGHYLVDPEDPQGLVVHNSYLQTLVDSGIFAALLYCGLLFGTSFWLWRSIKITRNRHPGKESYPAALLGALMVFAIASTFGSRETLDFYFILLMMAAAWRTVLQTLPDVQNAAEAEPTNIEEASARP